MVRNNIEVDVKVKCIEQGKTQAKLAEAIKGAALYQAKLLLPDECLMIPVTY